jgi:hypothetical protein
MNPRTLSYSILVAQEGICMPLATLAFAMNSMQVVEPTVSTFCRISIPANTIGKKVHNIPTSVPLHSGHAGGVTAFEELILPADISFDDFYTRVCAKMSLQGQDILLGYRFNKDLRRAPYHHLTNENELRAAMAKGADLIEWARTRRVVLEIQNMVCAFVGC